MQNGYCEIDPWAKIGIGLSEPNPIETSNARKNARIICRPARLAFPKIAYGMFSVDPSMQVRHRSPVLTTFWGRRHHERAS